MIFLCWCIVSLPLRVWVSYVFLASQDSHWCLLTCHSKSLTISEVAQKNSERPLSPIYSEDDGTKLAPRAFVHAMFVHIIEYCMLSNIMQEEPKSASLFRTGHTGIILLLEILHTTISQDHYDVNTFTYRSNLFISWIPCAQTTKAKTPTISYRHSTSVWRLLLFFSLLLPVLPPERRQTSGSPKSSLNEFSNVLDQLPAPVQECFLPPIVLGMVVKATNISLMAALPVYQLLLFLGGISVLLV